MTSRESNLACVVCSSTFFYTTHAEQFVQGGFGTAEFRSLSNAPKTLLVCIGCGTPVIPKPSYYARGTVASVAEDDFRKSVESGVKYRKANSINNIATIAASPSEVQELRDRVDELRKAILAMANPPVVPSPESLKPVKAKKAKEAKAS